MFSPAAEPRDDNGEITISVAPPPIPGALHNHGGQALVVHGWACPSSTPPPPAGFESAWQSFLPEMVESHKESLPQRAGSTAETPDSLYGAVDTSSSSA
eukprot:s1893_g11.t1